MHSEKGGTIPQIGEDRRTPPLNLEAISIQILPHSALGRAAVPCDITKMWYGVQVKAW
jgi:hypothetical protein